MATQSISRMLNRYSYEPLYNQVFAISSCIMTHGSKSCQDLICRLFTLMY